MYFFHPILKSRLPSRNCDCIATFARRRPRGLVLPTTALATTANRQLAVGRLALERGPEPAVRRDTRAAGVAPDEVQIRVRVPGRTYIKSGRAGFYFAQEMELFSLPLESERRLLTFSKTRLTHAA